jgi:sugar phosphate isomerase/epimerase
MPDLPCRRSFLESVSAVSALSIARLNAATESRPKLGVVVSADMPGGPDEALAKVHQLGFSTCQLSVGMAPTELAQPIRDAAANYRVQITAFMTLGSGRMVWNLKEGPQTIGLVPRATRAARIHALKRASDLAKACDVPAVHTHCGFIPENPSDPLYAEVLAAIADVARHCRANGQIFLCETGQETPITLLRVIEDLSLENVFVNLDLANLILYGKGEPVGALDVIGKYVRGIHAKDGLYPTDPYGLGEEVPIGQGKVWFAEVMHKLRKLSYVGPITIERETAGPQQQADIRKSSAYLNDLIRQEWG